MTSYADLEIRILAQQAEGYPVEITFNGEQEFPRGFLEPGFVSSWTSSGSATADGTRLFDWLFSDSQLKQAWAEVRGQQPNRRIRLRLDANVPELHALPWEALRDSSTTPPTDLAATMMTPFSRYLAGKWQPGNPKFQYPITLLLAIANPEDLAEFNLTEIDVATEQAVINEVVADLGIKITLLPQPCTLATLEEALKEGYHILHFVGHGNFSIRQNKAQLYLADEHNRVSLVTDTDFAAMLARQQHIVQDDEQKPELQLVYLSSCQTATRSYADAFRGFAPLLINVGITAVLAMQDLVPIDTAREFSRIFYKQLINHGQIDLACNEARSAMLTADLPGATIPALYMRQRPKGITNNPDFWPYLLEKIDRGQCIPFLGPRVNTNLLPSQKLIAKRLGADYGYPLEDTDDLIKVAQFIALRDPEALRESYLRLLQRSLFSQLGIIPSKEDRRRFRNVGFAETAEALDWANKVLEVEENVIHHMLADLELPLYITTNIDSFMVEALKRHGGSPRQYGPRWEFQAGSPQYVLSPRPSATNPVVFHLNGFTGDPEQEQHIVLSEDDYLAHFVRLSRDQETILPMNLLEALAQHSFIFLGYHLNDWDFRLILQGLLASIAQTGGGRKVNVGVQLEESNAVDSEKAMEYLQRYLGQFNIDIYWGTSYQFVTELHSRWGTFLDTADDDW